jgi:RimJ/RimL family protein N-acetyltransferase
MLDAARYSIVEALRDGRRLEIRSLRPDDRDALLAAVGRIGAQSLQRRFFGPKHGFTEDEIAYFVDVDFVEHVALVAVVSEAEKPAIVGGGRYVVVEPGRAEVAFAIVDQYQGQGIGAALMRHLVLIARDAGLRELVAEVLVGNSAMLKVFEKSGLRMTRSLVPGSIHVSLQLS